MEIEVKRIHYNEQITRMEIIKEISGSTISHLYLLMIYRGHTEYVRSIELSFYCKIIIMNYEVVTPIDGLIIGIFFHFAL